MPAQATRSSTHLPVAPSPTQVTVSNTGGGKATTLPAVTSQNSSLIIAGKAIKVDPTQHTLSNIVDFINNANIPGVTASIDRYGQLVINGINNAQVTGDAFLLQHLGFA